MSEGKRERDGGRERESEGQGEREGGGYWVTAVVSIRHDSGLEERPAEQDVDLR